MLLSFEVRSCTAGWRGEGFWFRGGLTVKDLGFGGLGHQFYGLYVLIRRYLQLSCR